MGTFLVILVLVLAIILHEFGHFITAKLFKVKVLVFSIFFWTPKKLLGYLSFKFRGTVYKLGLLPLGGFVQMKGFVKADKPPNPTIQEYMKNDPALKEGSVVNFDNTDQDAFINKPIWQRAIILAAGSVTNIVLAFIFFTTAFLIGFESYTNDVKPVKQSPIYESGVKKPIKIISVNNINTKTYFDVVTTLNKFYPNPVNIRYITCDNSSCKDKVVTVKPKKIGKTYMIGIKPLGKTYTKKHNFFSAINRSAKLTLLFPYLYLKQIPKSKSTDIAGPVGIVYIGSTVYKIDKFAFLMFCGMLMMILGIVNLLPLPILDGGHILFLLIEKLRGKPLSLQTQNRVSTVMLIILLFLTIFFLHNDISNICNGVNHLR